jgi:hypothetical protein
VNAGETHGKGGWAGSRSHSRSGSVRLRICSAREACLYLSQVMDCGPSASFGMTIFVLAAPGGCMPGILLTMISVLIGLIILVAALWLVIRFIRQSSI